MLIMSFFLLTYNDLVVFYMRAKNANKRRNKRVSVDIIVY